VLGETVARGQLVARGLLELEADDLARENLSLELGLSLWMRRTAIDLPGVRDVLLSFRVAVIELSGLDRRTEPVPLISRDPVSGMRNLCIYLKGLIRRASEESGLDERQITERGLAELSEPLQKVG